MTRKAIRIIIPMLLLSGCSALDSFNEMMPVIGKRCYNWECFSDSGQEKSDAIGTARQGYGADTGNTSAAQPQDAAQRKPINNNAPDAATPPPVAETAKKSSSSSYFDTVTPDNYQSAAPPPGMLMVPPPPSDF